MTTAGKHSGLVAWAFIVGIASSCSSSPASAPDGGNHDGPTADMAQETAPDTTADLAPDAWLETAPDLGPGTAVDAALEAAPEVGPEVSGGSDASDAATPSVPRIVSITPDAVFRGDEFTVWGTDFLPLRRVVLGDVGLNPIDATATALRLRAPADFSLSGCERDVSVVVETDVGPSAPTSLRVRDPGPSLASLPATLPAGATLSLTGCNLSSAQVSIGGRALTVTAASDTRVTAMVPRDAAIGAATVEVRTSRGEVRVQITVLPPTPQIVTTDLPTVGGGGIVFITTDVTNKALIDSVRVGAATISVTDPTSFKWADQAGSSTTSRMAVRVPATTLPGNLDIALSGLSGTSAPFPIMVVASSPIVPPAAGPIIIAPAAAGDDGTFPIGTETPFPIADPGVSPAREEVIWNYDLAFRDSTPTLSNKATCTGTGTVTGHERHCRAPCSGTTSISVCEDSIHDVCHPISGTYTLRSTGNQITLTIDRTSTGGVIEQYVGGWVEADGTSAPTGEGYTYLILRSQRTGIELSIRHYARKAC